jgi:hypothetical protein
MKKYAVGALLVVVLGALFGFRVEHPGSGLKNALGPASSGIVVYKKANQFAVGNKIVINTQTPETSPALVIVRAVAESTLDVQSGAKAEQIKIEDTKGKIVLVIPFIGSILNLIGL